MNTWLLLTATLPTHPSALRVRVWRALKATGAGTLREGVYLLPATAPTARALWDIEKLIHDSGVDAHMLEVNARDAAQDAAFQALFDRSDLYAELLQSIKDARKRIKTATETDLHKTLRGLEQQLHTIQASDFFPGKAGEKVSAALVALRQEVAQQLSPGEPSARTEALQRLALADFQGKTWATRKRPWVDRLATAWLVARFVDKAPRFVWLDNPKKCPKAALGFDFDGARFSHMGELVTFEVVMRSFGLETNPGLLRLGQLVHYIDVGGIPVDEAPGIETLVRGLQAQHPKDDALLAAALPLFDTLYAALAARP